MVFYLVFSPLFSFLNPFFRVIFLLFQHNYHLVFGKILYVGLIAIREVDLKFLRKFSLNWGFQQFLQNLKLIYHNIYQLVFLTKLQMYIPKFLINQQRLCLSAYIRAFECFFAFSNSRCFSGSKS